MIEQLKQHCAQEGSVTFPVKVHPNAIRTCIKDQMNDGTIIIDIAEVAEKGRANRGLIKFLSAQFGVPQNNVIILQGLTGRRKVVRVQKSNCSLSLQQ